MSPGTGSGHVGGRCNVVQAAGVICAEAVFVWTIDRLPFDGPREAGIHERR